MFYCLPDSAWADGNLAEAAGQVGKSWNTQIKVNPTQVYEDLYIRNKYFPIVHSLYTALESTGGTSIALPRFMLRRILGRMFEITS